MASPGSSPMMAGSEILDGPSLMSLQLPHGKTYPPFLLLFQLFENSPQRISVPPVYSEGSSILPSTQAHEVPLDFCH